MKSKRILAPAFLDKLDHWLLIHKPAIWSTRTHLVWWYGFLFLAVLTGIGFIAPNDPRNDSSMEVFSTLMSMVAILGLVFWLIFLLRFNVFKRFGLQSKTEGVTSFLLYFLSTFLLCFLPFSPSLIETYRANRSYTDTEIIKDINTVNRSISKLWHSKLQDPWNESKYRLARYDSAHNLIGPVEEDVVLEAVDTMPIKNFDQKPEYETWTVLDSTSFYSNRRLADSIIVINDSTFKSYKCPDYEFLSPWAHNKTNDKDTLDRSLTIFREIISKPAPSDTTAISKELYQLIEKYTAGKNFKYYYESNMVIGPNDPDYIRIKKTYRLEQVDDSMNNILERMHRWDESGAAIFLRMMIYFAFCLSLLLFMFRYSSARTFFLTLLTGVLLLIFTLLIMASSGNSASGILMIMLLYYGAAFILALSINSAHTRTAVAGIGLNIFTGITPFIPMIIYGLIYDVVSELKNYEQTHWYANKETYFLWSEIGGVVIFLLLLQLFIKKSYRKWIALPEE